MKAHNTVFTYVPVDNLISLFKCVKKKQLISFQERLQDSIKKNGLKDPLFVHFRTFLPTTNSFFYRAPPCPPRVIMPGGFFIKTGNNRLIICKELGIKRVPCIVTNFSGGCYGRYCYKKPYVQGKILKTKEDVVKLFHTNNVEVVFQDGIIVNAYTVDFHKQPEKY